MLYLLFLVPSKNIPIVILIFSWGVLFFLLSDGSPTLHFRFVYSFITLFSYVTFYFLITIIPIKQMVITIFIFRCFSKHMYFGFL